MNDKQIVSAALIIAAIALIIVLGGVYYSGETLSHEESDTVRNAIFRSEGR